MKINPTKQDILDIWEKFRSEENEENEEIGVKDVIPYYKFMLEKHMWDVFKKVAEDYPMPAEVQAWFVQRQDADEIMSHYAKYAGCSTEEILEGNGAVFLKKKNITLKTVEAMIDRFYLSDSDQMAILEISAPQVKPKIGNLLRLYKSTWGEYSLSNEVVNKAKKLGYL